MPRIAYVNGRYVAHADASVHIEDRGYQFADGVYEVIAIVAGHLVDEDLHLKRLHRSLGELRIALPMTDAAVKVVLREVIRRNAVDTGIVYIQVTRGAEEDVRSSWSRLTNQSALVSELETQAKISDDVLLSYREQFNIGRRSLLDVLDAQNTRYNVQAQTETARLAKLFAQYRVLASANRLIECLGVQMPAAARADQRARYKVNPIPPTDLQENSMPLPAMMGPPAPPPTETPAAAAQPLDATEPAQPSGR